MAFACALLALAQSSAALGREWLFDVTLDGLSIGTHRYVLREEGDTRRLTSDAHFRVRLLLLDAYRWDHHADEVWRGGCLASLDSATTEKGRTVTVKGREEEGAFVIGGPEGQRSLGACAMTFAYWNRGIFARRELVNAQTGAPTAVSVARLSRTDVVVHGQRIEAGGYRLETAKTRIDAYYDAAGEWVGLRSTTRAGHVLEYRLR